LDYSRYGDTLFELLFLGGRFAGGSMEVEYGESKLETNVRRPAGRPPPCPRHNSGKLLTRAPPGV